MKSLLLTLSLLLPFSLAAQNCTEEEIAYLAANQELLQEVSQSCAVSCIFSFNQDQCLMDCLSQDIMVSEGCLACSVDQINCVTSSCAFQCINAESQACQDCIEQNCMPNYFECIGANPNAVVENENIDENDFLSVKLVNNTLHISLTSDCNISIYSFDGKLISSQFQTKGEHIFDWPANVFIITAYDEKGRVVVVKRIKG
jgi:hypothetical protein